MVVQDVGADIVDRTLSKSELTTVSWTLPRTTGRDRSRSTKGSVASFFLCGMKRVTLLRASFSPFLIQLQLQAWRSGWKEWFNQSKKLRTQRTSSACRVRRWSRSISIKGHKAGRGHLSCNILWRLRHHVQGTSSLPQPCEFLSTQYEERILQIQVQGAACL